MIFTRTVTVDGVTAELDIIVDENALADYGPEYLTTVAHDPRAVFTHVGSGVKSYSSAELIAYALGALGLLPPPEESHEKHS